MGSGTPELPLARQRARVLLTGVQHREQTKREVTCCRAGLSGVCFHKYLVVSRKYGGVCSYVSMLSKPSKHSCGNTAGTWNFVSSLFLSLAPTSQLLRRNSGSGRVTSDRRAEGGIEEAAGGRAQQGWWEGCDH